MEEKDPLQRHAIYALAFVCQCKGKHWKYDLDTAGFVRDVIAN